MHHLEQISEFLCAPLQFSNEIGLSPLWQFHDCFGLDEELLGMTPQPCLAVLLLFPYDKMKGFKQEEREKIEKDGQHISPKLFYMRQVCAPTFFVFSSSMSENYRNHGKIVTKLTYFPLYRFLTANELTPRRTLFLDFSKRAAK